MTRYCLGPLCRDLVPLAHVNQRYCAECRVVVRAESSRRKARRFRERHPERHRFFALRWYRANREHDHARRVEYARRMRLA